MSVRRYYVPEPRVGIDDLLCDYAHAAADVSDGILADSMHIARASGLGLEIDIDRFSFSTDVTKALQEGLIGFSDVLRGGDDYELVLAVSEENKDNLISGLKNAGLSPLVIGVFRNKISDLSLLNTRERLPNDIDLGWVHF